MDMLNEMRIDAPFVLLWSAVAFAGCAGVPGQSGLQSELQNVSECFFEAVSILQCEPDEGRSLAAFLADAKAKQQSQGNGTFNLLRWDESGQKIILSGGQEVAYRVVKRTRDHCMNGAETTFTTYEFFTDESVSPARTTISFWIGSPPE